MKLRKRTKGLILAIVGVLCLLTVFFFADSIGKSIGPIREPLDNLGIFFGFLFFMALFLPLLVFFGTAVHLLYNRNKSRGGMLLASGFGLASLSGIVVSWLFDVSIWYKGEIPDRITPWFHEMQMLNVLSGVVVFIILFAYIRLVFGPLLHKWVQKKRLRLDTPEKKQRYLRYLQLLAGIITVLLLCLLPLSLDALRNSNHRIWGTLQINQPWYTSAWVHGFSVILSGVVLIVGIGLFLDRSRGKVPLGALLLGSGFVGLFILGFCYFLIAGYLYEWGIGNHRAYHGSLLFVILHWSVSAVAIGVALLVCRKRKKDTST